MASGGCCRSASMMTAPRPRAASTPAAMAISLPKLREKEMARTRESSALSAAQHVASSRRREPSSMNDDFETLDAGQRRNEPRDERTQVFALVEHRNDDRELRRSDASSVSHWTFRPFRRRALRVRSGIVRRNHLGRGAKMRKKGANLRLKAGPMSSNRPPKFRALRRRFRPVARRHARHSRSARGRPAHRDLRHDHAGRTGRRRRAPSALWRRTPISACIST